MDNQYQHYKRIVERQLELSLPPCEAPRLSEAIRYSLLAPGKRLRPVLTLAFAESCGGSVSEALPFACALEMIHCYSLIHDDLPCMDDDDLRRGRPTNHKVYGEAMAVLAGDGLLTLAFETMLSYKHEHPERALRVAHVISSAAGIGGMVGGQALDIEAEDISVAESDAERIDRLKTGALITVSALAGCMASGAPDGLCHAASQYGQALGLAFQIQDDILDAEGNPEVTGKTAGSDARSGKPTYMQLLGADKCRRYVRELTDKARGALAVFNGKASFQDQLACRLSSRTR